MHHRRLSPLYLLDFVMFETPQYVTGPFQPQRVFLPDREYGLALDALVKACSDVLILSHDQKRVLLGRRKVQPQPDWWYIGGRAKPGDTTTAAAARNVKREIGLDLPETRYEVVANYSMVWSYRYQPPTTNGTADLSTIHVIFLTEEEEAHDYAMDPIEYSESKWWIIDEVICNKNDRFHPLLVNSLKKVKTKRALFSLKNAITSESSDEIVSKASREFVKLLQAAEVTESSTKVNFDTTALKYVPRDTQENDD